MPFGVTGGPSKFGHVTGERFHDLIAVAVLELFVDDGGMASDSFEEGMTKLRTLLDRVRREKMSLSPSKLKLFMTGSICRSTSGPAGCKPRCRKVNSNSRLAHTRRRVTLRGLSRTYKLTAN
jgi:hypothetical protein